MMSALFSKASWLFLISIIWVFTTLVAIAAPSMRATLVHPSGRPAGTLYPNEPVIVEVHSSQSLLVQINLMAKIPEGFDRGQLKLDLEIPERAMDFQPNSIEAFIVAECIFVRAGQTVRLPIADDAFLTPQIPGSHRLIVRGIPFESNAKQKSDVSQCSSGQRSFSELVKNTYLVERVIPFQISINPPNDHQEMPRNSQ